MGAIWDNAPIMKTYPVLLVIVGLVVAPPLSAQGFSGGDDFSQTWSGLWSATGGGGAGLHVANGVLNFTDGSLDAGMTNNAYYTWVANYGTPLSDWHVQVDFTANFTPVSGHVGLWELIVAKSGSPGERFTVAQQWTYMNAISSESPALQAYTDVEGGMVSFESIPGTSHTATVRIDYLAATQTMVASYVNGFSITPFHSVNINSGSTDWNMLTGDTFTVTLQAWNSANASTTMPIFEGAFTADNFFAYTGTAIPEPGTAALLLGLGVFALALQRRPRHR